MPLRLGQFQWALSRFPLRPQLFDLTGANERPLLGPAPTAVSSPCRLRRAFEREKVLGTPPPPEV